MLPVTRTDKAEADLEAILDYLEERSPQAAERLAAAIDDRCELLCQFPELGRARDERVQACGASSSTSTCSRATPTRWTR